LSDRRRLQSCNGEAKFQHFAAPQPLRRFEALLMHLRNHHRAFAASALFATGPQVGQRARQEPQAAGAELPNTNAHLL
jgi:hypothetical protein